MADDQRPAPLVDGRLGPRADDDLRPDAGRIALGDCNQRTRTLSYRCIVFCRRAGRPEGACRRRADSLYCRLMSATATPGPWPLAPGPCSMRACVQRVTRASVAVAGEVCGQIGPGMLVLLGVAEGDTEDDARQLAEKISGLRIFDDGQGKMNLALADVGGAMLVVSQFTLLGDCRKGRRPSFVAAAGPEAGRAALPGLCRRGGRARHRSGHRPLPPAHGRSSWSTTARSRCWWRAK